MVYNMNSPGCDHDGQNTNSVYGKLAAFKITNVLYSNKYCCICLETCDGLLALDTCGAVDGGEQNLMILTLREMLEAIFDDTVLHILRDSSNHICPACTDSIQKTLTFIQKTKTHALIFAKYFTTLNSLSEYLLQLGDIENISTIVLNASLDNLPKDIKSANDVQSEGAKRQKEDESPRVRKKSKLADGREKRIETVDVEREERDMVVGVNTEGNELVGSDIAPCNNDKDNQELRQNSETTAPVTKECCPVCKKRPCVHENYLAAFEKRQINRIIECPECKEMLYTLTDLIKHVNMDHFKSKPTIRDVCNKIFQKDLVMKDIGMKDQVHTNLKTQESETDNQFVGEIITEEPPIGAEIMVQEETENNNEVIEQIEANFQMDIENINVHSDSQENVAMGDLIDKTTKILHLKQGFEDSVLNPAVLPIEDTEIIQEQTYGNVESGSDTEQIIQRIEVNSSDEQSIDKNVSEHALNTGIHIVCQPNQLDSSNKLVESNLIEEGKMLHLKTDATDGSDVQKKVLTGILKKGNMTSKKQRKSVRFGDCPSLSDWRKEFTSRNTDPNENAKIDAQEKTSEETEENKIISVNKDEVNKKRKDVDTLNSKSSSSPLVRKGLFNRPIRRDFSIVLTDIFKNINLSSLQMPISVYDDRYKNIITNLNKDKIVGSARQNPLDSATETEITSINKTDAHKGLANTELKVTLQTDLPETNQESSSTCKEKPISGIFESTKVSRKLSSKKKELPEVGKRPTDTLQNDSVSVQIPEIPEDQKEIAEISQVNNFNPEPLKLLKSTQHQIDKTPLNKNYTMNTQNIIHEPANNVLKTGCNDVQKEGLVTDVTKETGENCPRTSVSKNNDLNTQTGDLKTAQAIVTNTKGQSPCKETNDETTIRPNDVNIFNMEKKSPTTKDISNEHSSIHAQTNIVLKTAQVIVEKLEGYSPCKENTEKRLNILNDEKIFNIERSPQSNQNNDSTIQCLIHAETTELKATQEIVIKSKSQSSCLVRPHNQRIKTFARKQLPYKKVRKNTYKIIRELKKGENITVAPNNGEAHNKKSPFTESIINESTKTQLKLCQESVGIVGQSEFVEEGEIIALRPNNKVYNIEKTLYAPSNMKPLSNTQNTNNIIQEQTHTELNQQDGQTNNEEFDETTVGQSTCMEGETIIVKPNHDRVPNFHTKVYVSPNKKNAINKKSLINKLRFSQELLGQTKVQLACLEEGEIITVRPNDNKLFNSEKNIPPNKKVSGKTYNVIRKLEKGEVITVTPNNEQVYNFDRTLFEYSKKDDSTKTQCVIPTNKEVGRTEEVPISQENRKNNTVTSNSEKKVVRMKRKLLTHSGTGKKLRREVNKNPIVDSLVKKNGIKNRLSQKAAQNNPIRKGSSTIVHKYQKKADESDEITEEIKGPPSITEIIEEETIIEKNEKHALTYEKQRRGRTFECPECKKMLYSLKDLIAHVNKNNCKKARLTNNKEGQGVPSKDNIQRLKPAKIPTLINKKACEVPKTSKRRATSSVARAGEAEKMGKKEQVNNKTAFKKKTQKKTDAICTICNVLACIHDRYRQVYDKLRKNKACKCPECKQIMHTLSGFIAHVNKSHVENKIVLRDIYYNDFPSTFVQTDKKSQKVDSSPENEISRDTELEKRANCSGNEDLEKETPVEEFEVEFLEDLDELEEIQESNDANVSVEDKITENKTSEPLKCQQICPDKDAYTQHRHEHELLHDLYKKVTADLELEDRIANKTETLITEGNKRNHKCGTCGLICKSRMQLTLHLKSSGHFLQGTITCPQCAKRPCRHEKYLCAYETKKTAGKIECFECQETLMSLDALMAHVNTEHFSIKSMKCDGCNQMVKGNLFKKHNKKCQKPQIPVKCTKCPALFVNEEAYMVHNLEHELLELNEVSAKNVTKTSKVPENSEIIDDEKFYECGTCGKIFRYRSWLKLHLKATNHVVKRDLSCPQCSKRPCKHEEYLLLFENQNEKNKPKCQQCKDSLDSLSNYISHVNKDHFKNKAIKCDSCQEEFNLKSELIAHLKVHEPKLTCEHCFCEFRRSLFRKHKIKCQSAKKRVKCAKFPALIPNEKAYTMHKQEHREILKKTETTSVIKAVTGDRIISRERSNKNKYDCPICQFHCNSRNKLSTHINSAHKMESKRTCSVCNVCKKMISREATALHLRMHSKDCPYPCHGCSMRFKRSSERAMHVLKVHSGR